MTFFEELKWRGVVKDISSPELEDKLNNESLTFYLGTDPTADSLHIGHYASFVTAKRLAKHGHKPIILVGGATGLIGDPRPTAEREIISKETVAKNIEGLKKQVDKLLEGKAQIVNNYEWMKDITFLDFLRDIGKYINVNYMLSKDIISRRLETGITYAEFSYTLMQGYDFVYLNRNYNCTLQAAGSDQWGNITTGIELARKMDNKEVYGFTMPLILDATGKKFGKSEGNALWLDKNKTSSYELYQFLVNVEDSMVIDYLKIYTFLTKEEIEKYEEVNKNEPHLRLAHKKLAEEIITFLHGHDEYLKAVHISDALFKGNIKELSHDELLDASKSMDSYEIDNDTNLVDLLVNANITSSKREAREFITNNSISINGDKVNDLEFVVKRENAIDNKFTIIRKGKKKYYVIIYK